jgi:nucleoside-diphosphate-sugar epimerase
MKVLVTGARGLLGSELCQQLREQGAWVMAVDNGFRGGNQPDCDSFVDMDLSKGADLPRNFDFIFHMAAINGTDYFYTMPNELLANNVQADLTMFELAARCTSLKNFVYASSSEVVSGHQQQPVAETTDLTIQNSFNPRWSYRLAKMCGEHFLANSDLPWLILRYFNVYGHQSRSGHFVHDVRQKICSGDYRLLGADETRSFCYVSDAVDATIKVSQQSNTVINIGSDQEIKVLDAANIMAQALRPGLNIEWSPVPGRPGSAMRRCPNISKLKAIYKDFSPRGFQQGIAQCVPHWLDQSLA